MWLLLLLFHSVFTLFIYCGVVVMLLQRQHVPRYIAPGDGRPLLTPAPEVNYQNAEVRLT